MSRFKELALDLAYLSGWMIAGIIAVFVGIIIYLLPRYSTGIAADGIGYWQSMGPAIGFVGLSWIITSGLRDRKDISGKRHSELMKEVKDLRTELAEVKQILLTYTGTSSSQPPIQAENKPAAISIKHEIAEAMR